MSSLASSIPILRLPTAWRDDSVSSVHQYRFPPTPSWKGGSDVVVLEVVSKKDERELGGMVVLESELGRG